MESQVKLLGHPIHPMLIVFPLWHLATALLFDLVYFIWGNADLAIASFWMILAGVLGGLIAALFGFLDWLAMWAGPSLRHLETAHCAGLARQCTQECGERLTHLVAEPNVTIHEGKVFTCNIRAGKK